MRLAVQLPGAGYAARVLREAAKNQSARLGLTRELSLALVRDRRMRALNREWRGKDRPTDVLSFPQHGRSIGDVVISPGARRAREAGALPPSCGGCSRMACCTASATTTRPRHRRAAWLPPNAVSSGGRAWSAPR